MALSANSRLLLQPPGMGLVTEAGALNGALSLQVQEPQAGQLSLTIEHLGLFGPGVVTEQGDTGAMSITGIPIGGAPLVQSAPGEWAVDLALNASVLYQAVERLLRFEKNEDRLIPAAETFAGRVQGSLREQAGAPDDFIFEGSLSLDYVSGGLGWVRHLELRFAASAVTTLSPTPPGAESYRLRVQPVGFSDGPKDKSPSGLGIWQQQFQRAAAVWSGFGVQLDLVGNNLHVVVDASRKTGTDAEVIRLGWMSPDVDVIEVLFTSNSLSDGGGITLSCGSALASVVMTDQQPHPDLLAHEIGHVLNGVHPGAVPKPGEWKGPPGSIMAVPVLSVLASIPLRPNTLFRNAALSVLNPANLAAVVTPPLLGGPNRRRPRKQDCVSSRPASVRSGRHKP